MVMLFEGCMLREMKSLRVKGTAVELGKANKIQCVTITRCSCRHFRCKTFVNDCTVAAEGISLYARLCVRNHSENVSVSANECVCVFSVYMQCIWLCQHNVAIGQHQHE